MMYLPCHRTVNKIQRNWTINLNSRQSCDQRDGAHSGKLPLIENTPEKCDSCNRSRFYVTAEQEIDIVRNENAVSQLANTPTGYQPGPTTTSTIHSVVEETETGINIRCEGSARKQQSVSRPIRIKLAILKMRRIAILEA
jgi:hypothetical protein